MSRQPGKPKDDIWKHVKTLNDGKRQCNFCGREFKGGATRIRAHLSGTTGKGIAACRSVPAHVRHEALREFGDGLERGNHTQVDTRAPQLPTTQTNSSPSRPVGQPIAGDHPQADNRATPLPTTQPNSCSSSPLGQPIAGDQMKAEPRRSFDFSQMLIDFDLSMMKSQTMQTECANAVEPQTMPINCSSLPATIVVDQTQADTRTPQLSVEMNNSSCGPLGQNLAVNASDQGEAEARNEEMRCDASYGTASMNITPPDLGAFTTNSPGTYSEMIFNLREQLDQLGYKIVPRTGESEWAPMTEGQPMEIIRCTPAATERALCSSPQDANAMSLTEEGAINQRGKKRKVDVMNELVDPRQLTDRKGFVGQQFMHNIARIGELLMDERVSIIGVYGMGGVGKTALATHMKKEIEREGTFNHVYWITVSQECSIHKLQTDIAKRFGLLLDEDDDRMRAEELSEALETKEKELLILDDVWKKIDLEKVGIPLRMGGIKLILTTRLKPVCLQMNCPPNNIIEVKPLSDEEAWELFLQKLRLDETPVADEVLDIARCVARECKGLPLGIKVLATTMKGVGDIHQWRNTLIELQNWTLEEDVEDEVFKVLRFSYHKLNDKRMQKSFLFCALYPEDDLIDREELIMSFVDQGLINRMKRLEEIFDEGHTMLNKLVDSSLLEEASTDFTGIKYVKMHDLLRDMACRIVKVSPKYMIKSGKGLRKIPQTDEWTSPNLEVVSLMHNQIEEMPVCTSPNCPVLSTLILMINPLKCIPDFFFDQMPALTVLDLSHTDIKGLPSSISNMKSLVSLQLASCNDLEHVPPLGDLQALSRLVLSDTSIQVPPEGLEKLTNLKWLDLSNNGDMKSSLSFLSKLINLQFLDHLEVDSDSPTLVKVEYLEGMNNLEIFQGCLHDDRCFNAYVRNVLDSGCGPNKYFIHLGSETPEVDGEYQRYLSFGDSEDIYHLVPKDALELSIVHKKKWSCLCDGLSFSGASSMTSCSVDECSQLEILFCLSCSCSFCTHIQNLERLYLHNLDSLAALWKENEDIVESLKSGGLFPRLTCLTVYSCDNMEKLLKVRMLAHLPNLVTLSVINCEKMKEIFSGVDEDHAVNCDEVMVGAHNSNSDNADGLEIVLPKLLWLTLEGLPQLESVWQGIMTCDSFRELRVTRCPKLRSPRIEPTFGILIYSDGDSETADYSVGDSVAADYSDGYSETEG